MLEEDAEVWVGLGVDGGFEHWKENILQHLPEVWQEILGSEHITKDKREGNLEEREHSRTTVQESENQMS